MLIPGLIVVGVIAAFVIFFLMTYRVVDPNEAHVVVFMGGGRKLYAPKLDHIVREGESNIQTKVKTSYFYIPFLMKRLVLPLTNVKMDIPNIHLNDEAVAPFICDVISWIHINDPIMAAERLNLSHQSGIFGSLRDDIVNIVQATARAAAMHQGILDIMKNRKPFAEKVSSEVDDVLRKFGIELVNLEVNDIKDDSDKKSNVIADYESIRKVQVETKARIEIANKNREAVEFEQDNRQKSEVAKAQAEEIFQKKQIDKDKHVGIAFEDKNMEVARAMEEANKQKVEARRTLEVGGAEVQKQATIEVATGEAEAVRVTGEKEADVTRLKGEAEGRAIEAKGSAEAVAKDKMAEAMAKYNDAATGIEKIRAWIEVEKAKYSALGNALSSADLKLVQSGKGGNIFGFPLNAETGADIGQMLEGFDVGKIGEIISKFKGNKPKTNKPL